MRCIWVLVIFALFTPYGYGEEENETDTWVIENVNIIDIRSGKVVPARSVVFEGSTIVSVAEVASKTSIVEPHVIDGSGKFLIPGLWDMHIHTSTDAASRNAILPLLIANGITGARSMAADCHVPDGACGEPIADIHAVNKWREEIASGNLVGPRLIASSSVPCAKMVPL